MKDDLFKGYFVVVGKHKDGSAVALKLFKFHHDAEDWIRETAKCRDDMKFSYNFVKLE